MKELLIYLAKHLVDDPDSVVVTEEQKESEILFTLKVAPDDMGKIIGRHGRIAKELRTVMKSAATRRSVKVDVSIVD